jgi:predicted phosphoribosyltransferase
MFEDRTEGGRVLAERLSDYKNRKDVVVLALPRGGVPVAFEAAKALNAPLDVFLVRKLGVPGHEELGFGAIASGGVTVFNESLVRSLRIPELMIEKVIENEQKELERRETLYRANRAALDLAGKICIIVDDGLATGATMRAAVEAVKNHNPQQIIVAVPVAAPETCASISKREGVLCICAMTPVTFAGVGEWYRDFSQTSDEQVQDILARAETELRELKLSAKH